MQLAEVKDDNKVLVDEKTKLEVMELLQHFWFNVFEMEKPCQLHLYFAVVVEYI